MSIHIFMNKTQHRVIYADTDAGQVVYYANYFRWFESGRIELFRSLKINLDDLNKRTIIVPIVEAHCNYFHPAKLDDVVIIETRISEIKDKSVRFDYKVLRKKDKKLLASGHTINVFVDRKKLKAVKIPYDIRKKLKIN